MCVVGNIVRRCRAVHVEVPRRFIADIVADVRRIQAANLDILPPPERCAVCIRHRIRAQDGDVLPLDEEFVRLYRAEVQHVSILWVYPERHIAPLSVRTLFVQNVGRVRR